MKQITLSRLSARLIERNVSQRSEQFKPREAVRWGDIAKKITDRMGEYWAECRELILEAEEVSLADLADDERGREIRRINRELNELDESELGQGLIDLVLDDDDLRFVTDSYLSVGASGDEKARERTRAVVKALDAPIPVTAVDGKIVPIDEPPRLIGRRQARAKRA